MSVFVVLIGIEVSLWSAYYAVSRESVAVIDRFGMSIKEVPPGPHFKPPAGFDKATNSRKNDK